MAFQEKKINILFDATILVRGLLDKAIRTGIYFATYNILNQLASYKQFDITLYVHDSTRAIKHFRHDELLSKFQVCINTTALPKNNIIYHSELAIRTKNIFDKFIHILKVIKNVLRLLQYRNNKKILKNIDVFFSALYSPLPEIYKYKHIKHFIVLHDLIPLIFPQDNLNTSKYSWFNLLVNSLNKDTYYFCNSRHTKNDFMSYFKNKFDEEKIKVIYHATSHNFYPDYNKEKLADTLKKFNIIYDKDFNYLFSFCTIEPRKNLPFTLRCFVKFIKKHSINNLFFYLGGAQWDNLIHLLENELEGFREYKEKIIRLGYVNDEDVNILYSNSLFFTFISQYEGFGVPVLEAMQAGTPVITSNNSSLPEVAGDAAILIDYDSEEQCIKAFEDLYFNEDLRKQYIQKGIERANLFSWGKAVKEMTDIITSVAS